MIEAAKGSSPSAPKTHCASSGWPPGDGPENYGSALAAKMQPRPRPRQRHPNGSRPLGDARTAAVSTRSTALSDGGSHPAPASLGAARLAKPGAANDRCSRRFILNAGGGGSFELFDLGRTWYLKEDEQAD